MSYDAKQVTYQEVTILGKPALFTECRIDRTTVPEGMYRYELRHGDEDWGEPVTLSRSIMVNYYGSVLTREPFQLPVEGWIPLEGDSLFFRDGGCRTLAEFQKKYPASKRNVIDFYCVNDETLHDFYFSHSEEQDKAVGCVGHLRGDFGSGKQFYTTWWPHQNDVLNMTTVDGSEWLYDLVIYPKNQTGNPDLEKTVRESKSSTGKNNGSLTDITDGYAHTATASVGDTVDYQIISTLPTITSKASSLSEYTYVDTLSKGIKYNKNDVVIEFFRDSACTDKIATWGEDSAKFTVTYDDTANSMTIKMTEIGLAEINEATTVYTDSVKRGYSDCSMRITYAATLTADAQMGDTDNPNEVELTWKRTNTTYYDTLKDCCHVYTYGIDVLKQFSDGKGNMQNVKFNLHNDTDDVYVVAEQKDGVYYAKGVTSKKSDATTFVPNGSGHIAVKGLEDDSYSLTEIATDKGYVLLKEAVKIVITTKENGACEKCGAKLLTASATVNGKDVTMTDGNAIVPLTVINNPGFDLPKTGGYGTWMFTIGGVALLGAAAFIVVKSRKNKNV